MSIKTLEYDIVWENIISYMGKVENPLTYAIMEAQSIDLDVDGLQQLKLSVGQELEKIYKQIQDKKEELNKGD